MTNTERVPFTVIGENVHTTRSGARAGKHIVRVGDAEAVAFRDVTGADRTRPICGPVFESAGTDVSLIRGVGVAVVGFVRRDDGFVRLAPNLGWHDVPLAQMLADQLGLGVPVHAGNEADLAILAEHIRGAAADAADAIYVSGEVGIGGGVIVGGRTLIGHGGYAGEIGHMVVNPNGDRCGCGSIGCWETEVGEAALIRKAGRVLEGSHDRAVGRIIDASSQGDRAALEAMREIGRWMGIGLGGLVNIFNPEVIILGGLFARIHSLIADVVEAELRSRVSVALREALQVRASRFGADGPLLGSAELALEPVLARPGDLPEVVTSGRACAGMPAQAAAAARSWPEPERPRTRR